MQHHYSVHGGKHSASECLAKTWQTASALCHIGNDGQIGSGNCDGRDVDGTLHKLEYAFSRDHFVSVERDLNGLVRAFPGHICLICSVLLGC